MTDSNKEFNPGPLDEATLGLLVQLDETLRSGKDLGESLDGSLSSVSGRMKAELASAALCLLELEAAFPRASRSSLNAFAKVELPKRIGRFEIESQIGAGGFGIVYRGRDPELNRLVAIKVPRHHAFTESTLRRRFVREAHAAAQLDHPHIVPIYEAGEVDNLPYIAFAYCDGPTLGRWCTDQQEFMTPRAAASLLLKLVKAIQYSHSRGILHRDIKPSNVLLFPLVHDGDQSFPFTPKLADLGLAKLVESELEETASAMLLGTPTFMSPEQAQGAVVGPTSDVYSLGATLYFILTGRPPFLAAQLTDLLKQLVERDAVEPKTLNFAVDNDLNTICMKCLEKNPARRYVSASSLADDLERYLAGLPIHARPISNLFRLRRWCQRKPAVALLTACVCLLAVGLLGTLSFNSYRLTALSHQLAERNEKLLHTVTELDKSLEFAKQQQQSARDSERKTLQLLYVTDVQAAGEAWNKRDFSSAARLLNAHSDTMALREFSGRYLNAQLSETRNEKLNLGAQIWNVAQDHAGKMLAVGDAKGFVHLIENGDRLTKKLSWDTGQREVNCISFSPDDKVLAIAGDDGRVGVWKAESGELIHMFEAYDQKPVFGVAFVDDGKKLIACGNTPELVVWDVVTWTELQRKTTPHTRGIEALSISPDGQHVATVGHDGAMRVHRLDGLEVVLEKPSDFKLTVLRYDLNGQNILAADKSGQLHVWNATSGEERFYYRAADPICALALSPRGDICLADTGGVIYRLDAAVYQSPVAQMSSESIGIRVSVVDDKRVAGLAVSGDGNSLFTGNSRGDLERWTSQINQNVVISGETDERRQANKQFIALGKRQPNNLFRITSNALERWNPSVGNLQDRWHSESPWRTCHITPTGSALLVGDNSGRVGVSHVKDLAQIVWHTVFDGEPIDQIGMYGQDRFIAAINTSSDLAIYDVLEQKRVAFFPNQGFFDISPDARWLACGQPGTNNLEIIDLRTFEVVVSKPAHATTIWDVVFSADGSLLLTCSGDRTSKIWTTHDWNCQSVLIGHTDTVRSGSIAPDNQTIATLDTTGKVVLWYAPSAQKLVEIPVFETKGVRVMFGHDGKSLVVGKDDGQVYVLRAD